VNRRTGHDTHSLLYKINNELCSLWNYQQIRQGSSGFLLKCSKFYPDMFRQVVAIFRGSEVLYKLFKQYMCCGRMRIMIRPLWPVVVKHINKIPLVPWRICWSFYNDTKRCSVQLSKQIILIHFLPLQTTSECSSICRIQRKKYATSPCFNYWNVSNISNRNGR
jgi:hypothetical protein